MCRELIDRAFPDLTDDATPTEQAQALREQVTRATRALGRMPALAPGPRLSTSACTSSGVPCTHIPRRCAEKRLCLRRAALCASPQLAVLDMEQRGAVGTMNEFASLHA